MPVSEATPATAVERTLNILEAAAHRRDGLTNSEISRKLGLPKSSASYILRTLERRGYLRRDAESGRDRLGAPIFDVTGNVVAALGASGTLTQVEEANMPRIAEAVKETARHISRQLHRSGAAGRGVMRSSVRSN